MAPAGCHTHRHASRESYYKNMINLIHHIYHSSHPFGHITSHSIPCENKLDVLQLLLHVLRGCYGFLARTFLTYAKTTT